MAEAAAVDTGAPRSPRELFAVFNRMSLQGFGGVLPVAQHELVERERWRSREQFVEMLALAQVLPGPNIGNLALMFGDRHFGLRGALAALAGLLTVPGIIVLALAALYGEFAHLPRVAGALRGMGAVAAGLVIATALRLWPTLRGNPLGRHASALVGAAAFVAVGLLRWPMWWVVGGLGMAAVAAAWWRLGRR